jgi:hypothetical protein
MSSYSNYFNYFSYTAVFLYGFISGYTLNYIINLYSRYKLQKDAKKIIAREMYDMYTNKLFDTLYSELDDTNISVDDINSLLIFSGNLLEITNEYNKSFKIVMKNGIPTVKILKDSYLNNEQFVKVLKFLKKNEFEVRLLKSSNHKEIS